MARVSVLKAVLDKAVPWASPRTYEIDNWQEKFWFIRCSATGWWIRFKETHPQWLPLAQRYRAYEFSYKDEVGGWAHRDLCPDFRTLDDLVDWLSELLQLPLSVKNLLKMEALRKC